MNYYIQGSPVRANEIKETFERLGIDTTAMDVGDEDFIYFSSNGLLYFEEFSNTLLNIFNTHPDYTELPLSVNPNFKVGDWVARKDGDTFYGGNYAEQITLIEVDGEGRCIWLSSTSWVRDDAIRSWTIEDAKDGDVLVYQDEIFLVCLVDNNSVVYHCCFDGELVVHSFYAFSNEDLLHVHPATKEQHDLLFKKMREAGYEWDADKKELRKIQPHYDINNFKPFDKVLVRYDNTENWKCDLFSHISTSKEYKFVCVGATYCQCIPFEGNEHLLGTTDMPSEEYINW